MQSKPAKPKRPRVILVDTEADTLTDLALAVENTKPAVSELLLQEIERATTRPRHKMPADVVTLDSWVEFVDERNGARRRVQLVLPRDADAEAGRISVLTPIGVGLLGLQAGESILWPDTGGHHRMLKVLEVTQPEAVELP